MDSRRVTQLALRNYKSIESCDVALSPVTLLVGRNGVGKSNVVDALRFTAEALRTTLDQAIRDRGGIDQVRRKSLGGRPTNPGIAVRVRLDHGEAEYSFRIAAVKGRSFKVQRERCRVVDSNNEVLASFEIVDGEQRDWSPRATAPAVSADRLFLVAASGQPEFRPVFDILTRMTFLNLNPEVMKYPQRPESGDLLTFDGVNLASVIKRLEDEAPERLTRVIEFLQAIGVPITEVSHKQAGALETVQVKQRQSTPEGERNLIFDAIALSDGTIRALGILVALVSAGGNGQGGPTLIGIEEPETALHPAAAGALMEALIEGSERTQLILTCHSPDLLDHEHVRAEMIRPVVAENGRTRVGVLSAAKGILLKEHLSTAGELLRLDQLTPDPNDLERQDEARGTLFEAIA